MDISTTEVATEKAMTRSAVYRLLSKSFLYPSEEIFTLISGPTYSDALDTFLISDDEGFQRLAEEFQEMDSLWSLADARQRLEHEYNRLFAHLGSAKCPPYETEYGYDNVFQKTQAMADIAGFYRAYGLETADKNTERVDFIGMELEFMSYLALNEAYALEHQNEEQREITVDTQRKFLRDHLGRWTSIFAQSICTAGRNPFYLWLGKLTELFLEREAKELDVQVTKVTAPSRSIKDAPEPFDCEAFVSASQTGVGSETRRLHGKDS